MNVFVTNKTDETFEDGFAGEWWRFEPGVSVEIPEEAARHIFGYKDEDKVPYLIRLGWTITRMDLPKALEKLSKFEIHHSLSPVVERVPPAPKRVSGGKQTHQAA